MKRTPLQPALIPLALALLGSFAFATLPPLDDAARAKAAATAAKAAWQAKVDGYRLCKAQNKVAALYKNTAGRAAAKSLAAISPASGAATSTAVAAASPAPCIEPGPFAYNPPEQRPLETSGAHSPTGTAAGPPSVKEKSSGMAPARKP
jgi:hypothetical protein